jgi:competence protein ComEA
MTYDKARVGKYFGKLSFSEMREVEDGLEQVFDLGYADTEALTAKDKEIDSLKAQIAELTGEVAQEQAATIALKAKHEDELLSYKVENTMWQKCYERSLDQLVKMKVQSDTVRRMEKRDWVEDERRKLFETPPIEKADPPVEETPEIEAPDGAPVEDLLDINSCSATALKKIGFSVALAKAVVKARPFSGVEDLKKVPGMAKTKFQILAPKLRCVPVIEEPVVEEPEVLEEPVVQEKVNVNGVTGRELHELTGIPLSTAYRVTKYRRENGPFKEIDELLNCKQVYPGTLDKIRDRIVCGPYTITEAKPSNNRWYYDQGGDE